MPSQIFTKITGQTNTIYNKFIKLYRNRFIHELFKSNVFNLLNYLKIIFFIILPFYQNWKYMKSSNVYLNNNHCCLYHHIILIYAFQFRYENRIDRNAIYRQLCRIIIFHKLLLDEILKNVFKQTNKPNNIHKVTRTANHNNNQTIFCGIIAIIICEWFMYQFSIQHCRNIYLFMG